MTILQTHTHYTGHRHSHSDIIYTQKCANYTHITHTCYTHSILTTFIVYRYIHTLHTLDTLALTPHTPHIDGSLWDRVIKIPEQFKNKTLSQSCSFFFLSFLKDSERSSLLWGRDYRMLLTHHDGHTTICCLSLITCMARVFLKWKQTHTLPWV